MKIDEFAKQIVLSPCLEEKLTLYRGEFDPDYRYSPLRLEAPGRPGNLQISNRRKNRVPSIKGMADLEQRKRIIHAFANHELQAAELYAWALLAFADAPSDFRRDLFYILKEEQRHTRMYIARLKDWEVDFGQFPVSGYFWSKVPDIHTPLQFACAMALTFENANLDHTIDFAQAAREAGDDKTAKIIDVIHRDEAGHVSFGLKWLDHYRQPGESMSETYRKNVSWPLRPALAKGREFYPHTRKQLGFSQEFIEMLAQARKDVTREEYEKSQQ